MPRGSVSFGTAVAALVSTMGDAAWLLLATDFMFTLKLKVAFAVLGAAAGLDGDPNAPTLDPRRRPIKIKDLRAYAASVVVSLPMLLAMAISEPDFFGTTGKANIGDIFCLRLEYRQSVIN
mgnify:CR=1 FL=1